MPNNASLSSRGRPPDVDERDRQLIQLILAGDNEAFESLRQLYGGYVRSLIHKVLNWPEEKGDVDEVEQETWMQVYRSLGDFKALSSFGTWLFRITKNKCYDHLRQKKKRKIFVSSSILRDGEIHDHDDLFINHPVKDSDDYVEQVRPIADSIRAELAPEDRPIADALLAWLPPREISTLLGIPIKDVRKFFNKFHNKCRKMRVEGLGPAELMRISGKAKRRKRIAQGATERGDPE